MQKKTIDELKSLSDSMHKNQCYACSHEFVETVQEFGTNIIEDAIALIMEINMTLEEAYRSGYQAAKLMMPEIVRCKDCKYGKHIVSIVNGKVTIYRVFCTKPYVERGNATYEPDWFCADGKPRSD